MLFYHIANSILFLLRTWAGNVYADPYIHFYIRQDPPTSFTHLETMPELSVRGLAGIIYIRKI